MIDPTTWYVNAIGSLTAQEAVKIDPESLIITYSDKISSDESHSKSATPEEFVHAITVGLLCSAELGYTPEHLGHEIRYAHGSQGSNSDEVDIIIRDPDKLPYAMFELKSAEDFSKKKESAIRFQLFGTAPLVGTPKLLVYGTVEPHGAKSSLKCICIDYSKYKTYESWVAAGEPHTNVFPCDYRDASHEPYVNGSANDLNMSATQAEFKAIAASFHNRFFGEHPDNTVFGNILKCLLAKIHDERTCKKGHPFAFQIIYRNEKPESAETVAERINKLYAASYKRYIDPSNPNGDIIDPREFSAENIKTTVLALQSISITKGAGVHGDIIGSFFEQILRSGFKQDRGMYFTHDNLVEFMVQAIDLPQLSIDIWQNSNHPDNRLPYVIDPACGSGTFLLHAMNTITSTIRDNRELLVSDHDSSQFFEARLSDLQPNHWAESFIFGFDPKFLMAMTAKVNMVLHGDGSAHIFKADGLVPFTFYSEHVRLRPATDSSRSISRSEYSPEISEAFDVLLSNPPFGVTLGAEAARKLGTTFTLPPSTPSEGFFVERCAQLLKPGGRLGIVLPESILNSKDLIDVRLLLYRFFHLRAIVSLPRNIFIDTPTLTSLVFAQKKTKEDIADWVENESQIRVEVERKRRTIAQLLRRTNVEGKTKADLHAEVLKEALPLFTEDDWVLKGGPEPELIRISDANKLSSSSELADFYKSFLRTAGFRELCEHYIFRRLAKDMHKYHWAFTVDEVGYKLSKRREKARPNQLCVFKTKNGNKLQINLHLVDEPCIVDATASTPANVLQLIRSKVKWT